MNSLTRAALLLFACFAGVAPALAEKPSEKPRVKVEFRRAETKPAEGLAEATVVGTKDKVYLHKMADATNDDIAEARSSEDGQAKPAVEIIFTKEGAKKMAKLSAQHKDKPLAILVDQKVICAPVVRAQFSERALITGNFTREEVDKLVKDINGKPAVKPPDDKGFDSPQAATEALFAAMSKKDWKAGFRCFTAEGQELAVVHLIDMMQFVAIGTKKEESLQKLLKKHGFDVVKVRAQDKELEDALKKGQKPPDSRNEIKRYANQIKDKEAFFVEALTWVDNNFGGGEAEAPTEKQKPQEAARKDQDPPDPRKVIKDLKIKGDTASGKLNHQWTVEFRRVNGRWFVDSTDYDDPDDLFLLDYLDDIHGWSL